MSTQRSRQQYWESMTGETLDPSLVTMAREQDASSVADQLQANLEEIVRENRNPFESTPGSAS